MSTVFSNEDNLPGVITEVENDYSLGYDTSEFGTTDSVMIIGTAFDGPVGTPMPVYSPEHASYVFGKTYDSTKRQEATLVAGVQDAWNRGCRTIYAVRVGGKDLYKDFKLAVENGYRLRVSSRYPSNLGKQVYLRYDNTVGNETFTLYKPAARATIQQKKRGEVVSNNAVMKMDLHLALDLGLGRDANLVDVISKFNEMDGNNVLELSIVDENGVDVTNSTEAYAIPLGALFPGVYYIGRDKSKCEELTKSKIVVANGTAATPYSNFDHKYFRKLLLNTDVSQPYPIYFDASEKKNFASLLKDSGITMSKDWDFLETAKISDRAFATDNVDYEETKLSSFEMYKRLGNGYAITAKAISRGEGKTPRITETPMDDEENRIVPLLGGLYDAIQDAEVKYRVLTCVSADDTISSKLPRAKDFETTVVNSVPVLKDTIVLTAKVDENDRTDARKFNIKFTKVADGVADDLRDVYVDEVFPVIAKVDDIKALKKANVAAGAYIMAMSSKDGASSVGTLYRVNAAGETVAIHGDDYQGKHFIVDGVVYAGAYDEKSKKTSYSPVAFTAGTKEGQFTYDVETGSDSNKQTVKYEYVLGETMNEVFVYQPKADGAVECLGDLNTMVGDTQDESAALLVVAGQNLPFVENKVVINSDSFEDMTVGELVEALNAHPVTSKLFTAALTETGAQYRDYMVDDAVKEITGDGISGGFDAEVVLEKDRVITTDFNRYIPYRTTDNFARQLAQHCTYTELKTAPTHGFIGCTRQTDVSLTAIARRVAELQEVNFDLYAKNNYGRNILDRNNYPYAIGKNISIVFGQYFVNMENENYQFLSKGDAGYAGMVSILPLDQSSTSQTIDLDAVTFRLTPSQLVKMTKAGLVTFKQSFTKGIVVTDGITMAPIDSAFRRLAAWRIMGAVEDLIREAAEPFIGKQNHVTNRNSLYTAIKSRLEKIKGTLIEAYEFNMIVDPKLLKFSYINIEYTIVPVYEIREIRNQISVKDSLDGATAVVA